ncbi:Metal-dependent hydrolase, endonuclease/exonuclease/phosphatase family [Singulisphaera sp. GP187]|uniref:endonuclease/exonuclease/phosphatase family protein n=1 Tax=Singulisphaera sp. GP187 TaxID=1882752 RepID=UPI0009292F7E|nr:endonuclease/exonuclease/phosphatase family protein [Singulisphaera sp. GP187]SIO40045.1 Metal-dependent hydrolase, endonuclease/exonuclease/phosphatase family [Singulisphaera sp. GP187]
MTIVFLALSLAALTTEPAKSDAVRVMSYNIRYATASDGKNVWDNRKDFLAETIKEFNPDLLGTQETLARQRDDLAARLDGYEVLAAGRDDGRKKGEMMALFYRKDRFEKLGGGHFWLSETPEIAGSKGWDSSLPRMVTWVKLRDRTNPAAPPIAFFNTHFDHRGPKARLESARLLRKKIGELGEGCRIVVTGDFNSGEGSGPYKALFEAAEPARTVLDTFRVIHPTKAENEGTVTGFRAGASSGPRIDWIGSSTDWEVQEATIVHAARDGSTPSDHHAVTAVLRPAKPTN